jgi:hypothetical protein
MTSVPIGVEVSGEEASRAGDRAHLLVQGHKTNACRLDSLLEFLVRLLTIRRCLSSPTFSDPFVRHCCGSLPELIDVRLSLAPLSPSHPQPASRPLLLSRPPPLDVCSARQLDGSSSTWPSSVRGRRVRGASADGALPSRARTTAAAASPAAARVLASEGTEQTMERRRTVCAGRSELW